MLMEWFYTDEDKFGVEQLTALVDAFPNHNNVSWRDVHAAFESFLEHGYVYATALFISWTWWGYGRSSAGPVAVAGAVIMVVIIMAVLVWFAKAPVFYVSFPILSWIALLPTVGASRGTIRDVDDKGNAWRAVYAVIPWLIAMVLLVAFGIGKYREQVHASERHGRRHAALIADLKALTPQPHQLFVVWGQVPMYEALSPLKGVAELRNVKLLALGSLNQSPPARARLAEFGVTDVSRALLDSTHVFLIVGRVAEDRERLLADYMKRRHRVQIRFERYFKGRILNVYRIVNVPATGAP
jgi:hypothetical protein